jgi:hypothetical protein
MAKLKYRCVTGFSACAFGVVLYSLELCRGVVRWKSRSGEGLYSIHFSYKSRAFYGRKDLLERADCIYEAQAALLVDLVKRHLKVGATC